MEIKKGISLIVLVITIIVIIILAGAVILSLSNNNPIAQANEATFKSDLNVYNSELNMVISSKYVQDFSFNPTNLCASTWNGSGPTTGTIKELLPSIKDEDAKKYAVIGGKLVYFGTVANEKQWVSDAGGMVTKIFNYYYSGTMQKFVAPVAGTYTLEVYGASGGGVSLQTKGSHKGLGGYSKGDIALSAGQSIYIYVGGQGLYATSLINSGGGWNGGGNGGKNINGSTGGGGGGATDIRTLEGLWNDAPSLASRIIVAGGGGGADDNTSENVGESNDGSGGNGGGLSAEDARINGVYSVGTGATQTIGTLGKGQDVTVETDSGGAGGGYRGGLVTNSSAGGGGGGSSYIGGVTNATTQSGLNEGNGYVKITLL